MILRLQDDDLDAEMMLQGDDLDDGMMLQDDNLDDLEDLEVCLMTLGKQLFLSSFTKSKFGLK